MDENEVVIKLEGGRGATGPIGPIGNQGIQGPKGDPGSAGSAFANRAELRAFSATPYDDAGLAETGREGTFIFDPRNFAALVAADTEQAVVIPPAGQTGATGAWRRVSQPLVSLTPEMFGAKGDGVTNDHIALHRMAAFASFSDGAVIDFKPGATYIVGDQQSHNPVIFGLYTWVSQNYYYLMNFENCARGVVIRGNGATLRCQAGLKYGVFNADGTPMAVAQGYYGPGASTPYYQMLRIAGCRSVTIEHLELDGNSPNLNINGYFSDSGIQLPCSGLDLVDNIGPVRVTAVHSHHHGQDGGHFNGLAADNTATKELSSFDGCRFECNGRQGISFVGGKGISVRDCSFSWQGCAAPGSNVAGKVLSPPLSGVDFEAEGGKEVRDIHFQNCEFIGNFYTGIVADSGTDVDRISFTACTFIGTVNYSIWPNRPGFKFYNCRIAGTVVAGWSGETAVPTPYDAVQFTDCFFTNDNAFSPTGVVYTVNNLLVEFGGQYNKFLRCHFEHNRPGVGVNGNFDGARFHDCTMEAKAGTFGFNGRFSGSNTLFIESGGVFQGYPDGAAGNSGYSEDGFRVRLANGTFKRYDRSVDEAGNRLATTYTGLDANYGPFVPGVDRSQIFAIGHIPADITWTVPNTGVYGQRFRFTRAKFSTGAGNILIKTVAGTDISSLAIGEWTDITWVNDNAGWQPVAGGLLQ